MNSIKIKNEVMDAIVSRLFIKDEINYDRRMQNSINVLKGQPSSMLSDISITANGYLDISREHVEEYLNTLSNMDCYDLPYVSLTSDNSVNELRVILTSTEADSYRIPLDSLYAHSDYFVFDESTSKYTFFNR